MFLFPCICSVHVLPQQMFRKEVKPHNLHFQGHGLVQLKEREKCMNERYVFIMATVADGHTKTGAWRPVWGDNNSRDRWDPSPVNFYTFAIQTWIYSIFALANLSEAASRREWTCLLPGVCKLQCLERKTHKVDDSFAFGLNIPLQNKRRLAYTIEKHEIQSWGTCYLTAMIEGDTLHYITADWFSKQGVHAVLQGPSWENHNSELKENAMDFNLIDKNGKRCPQF